MSRVLLIGQAPGRGGQGPLFPSATGHRLLTLARCDLDTFKEAFEVVNLLQVYPGPSKTGNGDAFPRIAARVSADSMLPKLYGRRVLFLGRGVAGAFGFGKGPWLAWRWHQHPARGGAFLWAAMPHPSGMDHFYNDPGNRAIAGSFLRRAMEESQ